MLGTIRRALAVGVVLALALAGLGSSAVAADYGTVSGKVTAPSGLSAEGSLRLYRW